MVMKKLNLTERWQTYTNKSKDMTKQTNQIQVWSPSKMSSLEINPAYSSYSLGVHRSTWPSLGGLLSTVE